MGVRGAGKIAFWLAGVLAGVALEVYYLPLLREAHAVDGTEVTDFYVRYNFGQFQSIIDQLATPDAQRTAQAALLKSIHDRLGNCGTRQLLKLRLRGDAQRISISYRVICDKGSTVDSFVAVRQIGGRYLLDDFPGSRPSR